jgi:hypothetical protein
MAVYIGDYAGALACVFVTRRQPECAHVRHSTPLWHLTVADAVDLVAEYCNLLLLLTVAGCLRVAALQ